MPNLYDVQDALSNGQRKEAITMLEEVLREAPTANAWYMAALITNNEREKVRHLQRALLLDPDHEQSKAMLKKLGKSSQGGLGRSFLEEIQQAILDQSARSPFLSRLPRSMQLGAALLVVVFIIGLFGVTVALFLELGGPQVSDTAPTAAPIVTVESGDALSILQSRLGVVAITPTQNDDVLRGTTYDVQFVGLDNTLYTGELIILDSPAAYLTNVNYFEDVQRFSYILGNNNVYFVVSRGLTQAEVDRLSEIINVVGGR